jgi:hypothetical protein
MTVAELVTKFTKLVIKFAMLVHFKAQTQYLLEKSVKITVNIKQHNLFYTLNVGINKCPSAQLFDSLRI